MTVRIAARSGIPTPTPMPTPTLAPEEIPEPLLLTSSIKVLLAAVLLASAAVEDTDVESVDVELIESVPEAELAEGVATPAMLKLVVLEPCVVVIVEAGMSVHKFRHQHTSDLPALDVDTEVAVVSIGNRCANASRISLPPRPANKIQKASLAMAVTWTGKQSRRKSTESREKRGHPTLPR